MANCSAIVGTKNRSTLYSTDYASSIITNSNTQYTILDHFKINGNDDSLGNSHTGGKNDA
jgi:hypothetical protein